MRVAVLDPTVLDRLHTSDPVRRWQAELLGGSYLVDPLEAEGEEAELLRQITPVLADCWRLADEVNRVRHPLGWVKGGVPPSVWIFCTVVFVILAALSNLLWAILGTPLILGAVAIIGLGLILRQELRRRRLLRMYQSAYQQQMQTLSDLVVQLSKRTFVIYTRAVIIVSVPHLLWLGHRLRDLRESRSPVDPPERQTLVAALNAEHQRISEVVRRIEGGERCEAEELLCDIKTLSQRFSALNVRMLTEGTRLAGILPGGAQ